MDLQQAGMIAARQRTVVPRGEQDAAGEVVLLDRPHRMRADMDGEHVADVQLRAEPGEQRRDAGTVGVGEFGEVAGAHQQFDFRPAAARLDEAAERRARSRNGSGRAPDRR